MLEYNIKLHECSRFLYKCFLTLVGFGIWRQDAISQIYYLWSFKIQFFGLIWELDCSSWICLSETIACTFSDKCSQHTNKLKLWLRLYMYYSRQLSIYIMVGNVRVLFFFFFFLENRSVQNFSPYFPDFHSSTISPLSFNSIQLFWTATHVLSKDSITHSEERAIYPLLHTCAHRCAWLDSVAVIDRQESVCHFLQNHATWEPEILWWRIGLCCCFTTPEFNRLPPKAIEQNWVWH